MATYTGRLLSGIIEPTSSHLGQHFDLAREEWHAPVSTSKLGSSMGQGSLTNTQPVTENPQALTGERLRGFERDWYNRLHVSARSIDLGNVISQQNHTITVWNAYFEEKNLTGIALTGQDSGLDITEPRAAPTAYRPLEELTYTITVTPSGDPLIDAVFAFDFDGTVDDFTIAVTGSRIIAWLFPPGGEILERLEWLTNVITSYNGTEQRVRVRQTPRRFFEWDFLLEGADRRNAEHMLFGWQGRAFAIPVWNDGAELAGGVSAGAASITVDTTTRDYHAGGLAILMTDAYTFEVLTINTVSAGSLGLTGTVINNWPAGTKIYPLRMARLPDSVNLRRFTGDAAYGRLRWQCTDISDYTAATETTYRGHPVLEQVPNWVEDVSQDFVRKLSWMDSLAGKITVDDEAGVPVFLRSHRWLLVSRTEIDNFRKWLYARKGRLTSFWLPSCSDDLTLQTTVSALAVNIDVSHTNYTKQVDAAIGRRDLRIELTNGTVFYRRIVDATEVDADTERLQIDSNFGQIITPADVRMISFMALGRLEADAVELRWWTWENVETALNVRTATNDV